MTWPRFLVDEELDRPGIARTVGATIGRPKRTDHRFAENH